MATRLQQIRTMRLIRPEDWNRVTRKIGAKKNKTYHGRESGGWRHAWHTVARWDPSEQAWALQIKAGYVNASETEAPAMRSRLAPALTRERLGIGESGSERIVAWLSEAPWIRVPSDLWREIGGDAISTETVPEFFSELGVEGASVIAPDAAGESAVLVAASPVPRERRRHLRAVDIVLRVPKPIVVPELTEAGGGNTRFSWTVQSAAGNPQILLERKWEPQLAAPSLQEQLVTGRSEDPYTEALVATVYLLSRPGLSAGSAIGPDWQPHVNHALFWNRIYQAKVTMNLLPEAILVAPVTLAGGAGQGTIQGIVDELNARDAELANALGRSNTLTSFGSV